MNIIQLYVNDSGAGTPFEEGPNVIVIPTSLFTETVFNAHVQNETLDETPIYRSDDEIFKFISVGRDGDTEQACDEIDFVIIRFNISSQDAMEILNLLLECLVNETTNQTAIVFNYASTKLNDTSAVMMNLPIPVLGFIPWFCAMESSLFGKKPKTSKQAFWEPLKKVVSCAVGLIITIGMAFVELIELIGDFIMEILMDWLPILEFILWLIICALMLIFIYIMFAINFVLIVTGFVIIILLLNFFNTLIDGQLDIKINSVSIQKDDKFIKMKYKIGFESIKFFAFDVPTIYIYYVTENTSYNIAFNFFTVNIPLPSSETFSTLIESSEPTQSSGSSIKQFYKGINTAVFLFGTIMIIIGSTLGLGKGVIPLYLQIILLTISLVSFELAIISFISYIISNNGMTKSLSRGLGLGTVINMVASIILMAFGDPKSLILNALILAVIASLFNLFLNIGIIKDIGHKELLKDIKSGTGFATLIVGFLMFLGLNTTTRMTICMVFIVTLAIILHLFIKFLKSDES